MGLIELLDVLLVLFKHRQRLLGERLQRLVVAGLRIVREQGDGVLVRGGLQLQVFRLEGVARQALELVELGLIVGLQFGSLIGQAVVIEKLFAWPGIGSLLVDSVAIRDIPVVQGTILVIVLWFLVINTAVDLVYAAIDPRIKQE